MREAPPIAFRPTPDAVYLLGTAAGPAGADRVVVDVEVTDDGHLTVRSAAAQMLWSGTGSSQLTTLRVGARGSLDWRPEAVIVTAGARHVARSRVSLDPTARLDWTEVLVVGRHGEGPGDADLRLDVDVDGRPLLRHQVVVGPDMPGWDGPAVLGGHRALAVRLVAGTVCAPPPVTTGAGWAWMPLDGPGWLLTAVADDLPGVLAILDGSARCGPTVAGATAG
jgi:urease accessory protein